MLKLHSHNIFLEIGSTAGIIGLVGFAGTLAAILMLGLQTWRRSTGTWRVWVAGCVSGIVAAVAWGLLDVLWVTPPFFSFPVWGLVGLLVAAARPGVHAATRPAVLPGLQPQRRRQALRSVGQIALAIGFVLLPALASARYAAGFLSLQEHRWVDSISHLEQSARYNPLEPQSRQLLAEAYLGQGDAERAAEAYQGTSQLKRAYSPTYSQLGWLAWLQGDMEQAIEAFQQAIEHDPGEAWREGLHADLGLAYAAQGRVDDAILMFKETIELNPQVVAAPYWRPVVHSNGRFDVVLDPVYLSGPSVELGKRILVHLGAADYTERLFGQDGGGESPVSLNDVLDGIYADYQMALSGNRRQAPLLLSALAEASRLAGLHLRAEQSYLEFQSLQPDSAFGFRDLGILYREQGRLIEAQAALERAIEVSPRDFASRYSLALTYLDRGMLDEAEQALSVVTRQSLVTLFRSRLTDPELYTAWAQLYHARGDLARAISAQRKATFIRQWPADYLDLADLYRRQGQAQEATEQCMLAAEALLRTWPRPLDRTLWQIGTCLAQSEEDGVLRDVAALTREYPLIGNVLLGHVYRMQGQWEEALTAYQRGASARPDEGAPHYFLGQTYQALGQPEVAEAEYRQAMQLDPLESLPLLALGQMQWSQGQRQAAVESFREAVEVTPAWGQAHVALGNALLAMGDREGAARHYQAAQVADGDIHEGVVYDLAAHLAEAGVESPGSDYVRIDHFAIGGDEQRVLFMHPNSRASYGITPQSVPGLGEGGLVLAFDVAIAPESWAQPGDGVSFAVYVESPRGTEQVFSTYIDPKQDEADRRWHSFAIDLSAYTGQAFTLVFETDAGPAGDDRYDWAGWGTPRLVLP